MASLPLFEAVVFIALIGILVPVGVGTTTKWVNSAQHLSDAQKLESTLYLAQIKAKASRSDQWVSTEQIDLTRKRLNFTSLVSINGSGRLGYHLSGATQYAGTAKIGTQYRVTLGVGYAKPNLQRQL